MEQRFTDPGTWMYMEELQAPATTKHQRLVLPNNAQQAHSRNMQKHAKTLNLCKGLQRFNMFQPCKDENVEYIKISTYFNKAFPASTPQHLSLDAVVLAFPTRPRIQLCGGLTGRLRKFFKNLGYVELRS